MTITIINYGSEAYQQMVALRMEVLRKPLGLTFAESDLKKEETDILIGAFDNGKLIGCCILTPKDAGTMQLRQMAVAPIAQGQQIGTAIVTFAEKLAREKGYNLLMMHARKVAMPFYQKCGYVIRGNEFTEVGLPHFKMEKKLQS